MKKITKFLAMVVMICVAVSISGCQNKETASYRVLDEALDAEEYGIGFRIGDIALGLKVQETLDAMIADGTAAQISKNWFGEDILLT